MSVLQRTTTIVRREWVIPLDRNAPPTVDDLQGVIEDAQRAYHRDVQKLAENGWLMIDVSDDGLVLYYEYTAQQPGADAGPVSESDGAVASPRFGPRRSDPAPEPSPGRAAPSSSF